MEQWKEDHLLENAIEQFYHRRWRYQGENGWASFKDDCYSLIESAERIKNKSELMETNGDNKE